MNTKLDELNNDEELGLVQDLKKFKDSLAEVLPEECQVSLTIKNFGSRSLILAECWISERQMTTAKLWVPRGSEDWHQQMVTVIVGALLDGPNEDSPEEKNICEEPMAMDPIYH